MKTETADETSARKARSEEAHQARHARWGGLVREHADLMAVLDDHPMRGVMLGTDKFALAATLMLVDATRAGK